jgi:hypothetical protein
LLTQRGGKLWGNSQRQDREKKKRAAWVQKGKIRSKTSGSPVPAGVVAAAAPQTSAATAASVKLTAALAATAAHGRCSPPSGSGNSNSCTANSSSPTSSCNSSSNSLCVRHMHRWASTSISMSAISDIDISYSDIGDKYVGLKNVIPISEVFRYRHQSSFRYPTLKEKIIYSCKFEPAPLGMVNECYTTALLYLSVRLGMSDIVYGEKIYSDPI